MKTGGMGLGLGNVSVEIAREWHTDGDVLSTFSPKSMTFDFFDEKYDLLTASKTSQDINMTRNEDTSSKKPRPKIHPKETATTTAKNLR